MIDLDALELPEGEPITGYVHVETKAYRALIAELRACRKVVGFAQWVRDLPIADRQSPQREIETAIRLAAAALAELEAPK